MNELQLPVVFDCLELLDYDMLLVLIALGANERAILEQQSC